MAPQTHALKTNRPPDLAPHAELVDVPFFPQEDYQCGPAALAMVLNAAGVAITPEALVQQVYLPGRKGSLQVEMLAATRRNGMLAYELAPALTDLITEVAAGNPVVVLENFGVPISPLYHYAVVVGYDIDAGNLILRSGLKRRETMPLVLFERLWSHGGYWAMLALPPSRLPATATEFRYLSAAQALEKSGQLKTAKTAYLTLLARWPQSLTGRMGLGNTAYALGETGEAEQAFRRAALDHDQSAPAFNNLAQTLADQGKYPEALDAARQAVKLGGEWLATSRATFDEIEKKAGMSR
ncbi:MAG TPA: PA2778 family cysteine peptidase [Thiobacillaceae bacterium]|nr:PA2778 family cysteine peptidase [Thiobacillaceae bacterium]